jgi:predicted RNA binding protein YcfA (HicA-like mRNA interferase family)
MPKLPALTSSEVIKLLEKHNFVFTRQKGSHKIFKKEGFLNIVVPVHSGKELKKGLISRILKDANIEI